MTGRVDFYISEGADEREVLELTRALCQKAFDQQMPTFVRTANAEQRQALDDWLWSTPATGFLPHGEAGCGAPVEIGENEPATHSGLLINLGPDMPVGSAYARVAEIVSAAQRSAGREKFREHRKRIGSAPPTHSIKARFSHG